jgi:hypothetical protein
MYLEVKHAVATGWTTIWLSSQPNLAKILPMAKKKLGLVMDANMVLNV